MATEAQLGVSLCERGQNTRAHTQTHAHTGAHTDTNKEVWLSAQDTDNQQYANQQVLSSLQRQINKLHNVGY